KFGDIAYFARGSGPAAVFLHAFPLNGFQWREVIEDLAPIRRCIAPDLLGLGYTRVRPGQEISFDSQAAAMAELLDSLKIDQVDLIGNDTGAGISQIFTAKHPSRVRSLTLTNCEVHNLWPNAMLKPLLEAFAAGAAAPVVKLMAQDIGVARKQLASTYEDPERSVTPELTQLYFQPLIESEARVALLRTDWQRNREQLVGLAAQLRASKVPAQVIWGEADSTFDVAPSIEWLRTNLGGLRKTTMVPRGRLFFPEEHPRLTSVLLKEFWS
ncbi:MAG TPA: alpha/beta hydrolase, partial [Candidatus Binataceae bacterium]